MGIAERSDEAVYSYGTGDVGQKSGSRHFFKSAATIADDVMHVDSVNFKSRRLREACLTIESRDALSVAVIRRLLPQKRLVRLPSKKTTNMCQWLPFISNKLEDILILVLLDLLEGSYHVLRITCPKNHQLHQRTFIKHYNLILNVVDLPHMSTLTDLNLRTLGLVTMIFHKMSWLLGIRRRLLKFC